MTFLISTFSCMKFHSPILIFEILLQPLCSTFQAPIHQAYRKSHRSFLWEPNKNQNTNSFAYCTKILHRNHHRWFVSSFPDNWINCFFIFCTFHFCFYCCCLISFWTFCQQIVRICSNLLATKVCLKCTSYLATFVEARS